MLIVNMSNSQKKVSLAEYYSQLQKYQSYKQPSLKKENSLTGLRSEALNHSNASKPERVIEDRYKLSSKQSDMTSYERRDYSNLQQFKRSKGSQFSRNAFNESLAGSNVRSEKWTDPVEEHQQTERPFNEEQEEAFVKHCQSLYQCRGSAYSLRNEIDKRDEVYQLVTENIGASADYPRRLKEYFEEHLLMAELIQKLKRFGEMEDCESMTDLNNRLKLGR